MIPLEDRIAFIEARQPHTVHAALGIRIASYQPVLIELDVDERHLQEAGIVHGGVFVLMAESAASLSAALEVDIEKEQVSGMEINANHLRPVRSGRLQARPTLVHAGRTTRVYSIELSDEQGRKVCISRCTIAVRPRQSFT